MDAGRFDSLAKTLSTTNSRRLLLATLASGMVAVLGTDCAGSGETLAKNTHKGHADAKK